LKNKDKEKNRKEIPVSPVGIRALPILLKGSVIGVVAGGSFEPDNVGLLLHILQE
jgi:hypothetical protein